jgi:hypothetical protein
MRTHQWFKAFLILLAVVILPAAASADAILLNSDLSDNEWNSITGDNVRISFPHPDWMQNGTDYFWVSYQDTGYPPVPAGMDSGDVVAPGTDYFRYSYIWPENVIDFNSPTAIFYESFSLPYEINTGKLTIWADDTAGVYLGSRNSNGIYDFNLLAAPNPIQSDRCADGKIGCLEENGLLIDLTSYNLGAGDYQFRFETFQRGGGPFGIMYTGFMDSQPVPEPSTLLLLAGGLGCIGFLRRRKK